MEGRCSLPQASVIWFAIHSAVLFHHRAADPKSVEPTHCQVGPPLALQARQGPVIVENSIRLVSAVELGDALD